MASDSEPINERPDTSEEAGYFRMDDNDEED